MIPTTQIAGAAVLILVESNTDNENLWTTAHLDRLVNTAGEHMENQVNDFTVSPILLFSDETWHPGLLILTSHPAPPTNTTDMVTIYAANVASLNTSGPIPSPDNLSSASMDTPDLVSNPVDALSVPPLNTPTTPTDIQAYWTTLGLSLDSTDHYANPNDSYLSPSSDDFVALTELKTYFLSPNFTQIERELGGKGMHEFGEWIRRGSNPIENKKGSVGIAVRSFLASIAITVLDIIVEGLIKLKSVLVNYMNGDDDGVHP